jgi:acetylornithine deacetylase/succinyl-diaminopimelate desuccinylase-like protein
MAARLRAGGFPAADVTVFTPAPRKGNLVARLRGTGARRPIMLLAHLDVVEARREDWSSDPFKLLERDGYFYGRGTGDDKFMGAAFVATLIRYKREGFVPDRDLILVLETDEEILDVNAVGMQWLLKNHRDLIEAEYALNEGGPVGLKKGKAIRNNLQITEKVPVNYRFEVKNSGGHSSLPTRENAIYRLAEGLGRLAKFDFPVVLNDTTRVWLEKAAPGQLMTDVQSTLVRVLGDAQIAVTPTWTHVVSRPAEPNPELLKAVEQLTTEFWPGIPVIPTMSAGATTGSFLRNAGIPTYGTSGLAGDVDDVRSHGKDERVLVKSFFEGQEYLYRLVKALSTK